MWTLNISGHCVSSVLSAVGREVTEPEWDELCLVLAMKSSTTETAARNYVENLVSLELTSACILLAGIARTYSMHDHSKLY